MIPYNTLTFLKDLKLNNQRDWFLANQRIYLEAKSSVVDFVQTLINILAKESNAYLGMEASKCLFRINRDVRFSHNKSPYKTNFGASINTFGKKSFNAGFYVHIEPGNSFIGGGCYRPPADMLSQIRQEIDYNLDEFVGIINDKKFTMHFGGLAMEDALKKPPKGYDAENEGITYLKLKSFIAFSNFSDKELSKPEFTQVASDKLIALLPLIEFLNRGTSSY